MNVLFVDEEKAKIAGAMKVLERAGWNCSHCTFDDLEEQGKTPAPDLLVLDLMDGGNNEDPKGEAGNSVFKSRLSQSFCPIIVYSANPALLEDTASASPLVELVKKGTGAHKRIEDAAKRLLPAIEAVTTVRSEVNGALENALLQFIPPHFQEKTAITVKGDAKTYVYLARRRVAAMLDEMATDGGDLRVWEQYLYPALGGCPLLGDLLRAENGGTDDSGAYRLVLTPSCDLDAGEEREPKVDRILVAKCGPVSGTVATEFREPTSNGKAEKTERRLRDALTEGLGESAIPLPAIPGVFPDMAADLKRLELLDYTQDGKRISGRHGGKATKFLRVASVDSPYREQMAWNYQRVACRPGMPDRDIGAWAKAMAKQLKKEAEVKKK